MIYPMLLLGSFFVWLFDDGYCLGVMVSEEPLNDAVQCVCSMNIGYDA